MAYREAKLIAQAANPSSDQLAEGTNRLNDLINLWQTDGLRLWLNEDTAVPLTAGVDLYTFGPAGTVVMPKPLRVIEGYYLDNNNIRRPIYPLARNDWDRLSIVSQQGQIINYFADKQVDLLNVWTYLVPDSVAATGTMHLILQNQVTHFTGLTDEMNFPPEWFIALRKGLAYDLATGQPDSIVSKLGQEMTMYKDKLDGWDVEDAPTQFQPDMRMGQNSGRFR